jgi:Beta-propeller repeat
MNKIIKYLAFITLIFSLYTEGVAQVAINTDGSAASPNTMLDLNPAIGKAFVPPKMTYTQIKAISPVSEGMIVYDTDAKTVRMYDGKRWASLMPQAADNTTVKGETGSIFVNAVATDAAGNVYITGYIEGTATFGVLPALTVSGVTDIFIAKYNSSLALQWVKKIGGPSDDVANGIAVDAAGNIYITGVAVVAMLSPTYGFLTKFSTDGTQLWTKNLNDLNGATSSGSQCIALDGLGFVYIGGAFSGTLTFGGVAIYSLSSSFVAKYSIDGTEQWAKAPTSGACRINGMATNATGDVYITGGFYSTLTLNAFSVTAAGSLDAFVAKYSASGTEQWLKRAGGATHNEEGTDIAVDGVGNAYITGMFNTTATFGTLPTLTTAGFADIFIAKYSNLGAELWAQKAGGIYTDEAEGIALDASGNIYIQGSISVAATFGALPTVTTTGSSDDAYTAKYDNNGAAQWVQKVGGSNNDSGKGIAVDAMNRIYTAGHFSPSAQFGNQILTTGNIFIMKYSE